MIRPRPFQDHVGIGKDPDAKTDAQNKEDEIEDGRAIRGGIFFVSGIAKEDQGGHEPPMNDPMVQGKEGMKIGIKKMIK